MLGIAYEPVLRGTAVITLLLAELKQLSSAVVGLVDSPVVEVGLVHNPEVEVGLVHNPEVEVGLVHNPEVEVVQQVDNLMTAGCTVAMVPVLLDREDLSP